MDCYFWVWHSCSECFCYQSLVWRGQSLKVSLVIAVVPHIFAPSLFCLKPYQDKFHDVTNHLQKDSFILTVISECDTVFWMWQNVSECDRVILNVTECFWMWQSVSECDRVFLNVTVFLNVKECFWVWHSVSECDTVFWMWQSVSVCDTVILSVTPCFWVWHSVFDCYIVFLQ